MGFHDSWWFPGCFSEQCITLFLFNHELKFISMAIHPIYQLIINKKDEATRIELILSNGRTEEIHKNNLDNWIGNVSIGTGQNHRIIKLFRFEKTFEIIESNC